MLQNLPPKRVCRQILPQLNQKSKNKKVEEKTSELLKEIPSEESPLQDLATEQTPANNTVQLVTTDNKKSNKVKSVEKVLEEKNTINTGNDAIVVDKQKTIKNMKSIRKVNQKLTKDISDEKIIAVESQRSESKDEDNKKKLRCSPRNQSNIESVEENISSIVSPVKRRPKKISDCIAKLQEKLGLPFFGTPANNVPTLNEASDEVVKKSLPDEVVKDAKDGNKPIENDEKIMEKIVKTPKRKSITRKIVKTEPLPPLAKKCDQQTSTPAIKSIQIQTVHPTIQHQSTQHYAQKPIAHVEAIRPKHFSGTSLPSRRPSILLPTLVPPPPPPPIILPSTVTLPCEIDDAPLDLSRKPSFENGALDLSKASNIKSCEINTNSIVDILKNKVAADAQQKRRRNKKEVVSVSPIPKPSQPLPTVNELKNKLPNMSITSKCVLNIPQTSTFDKSLEPKKPINENTQLVIPNFKGCVDIIKIPAPKPPVIHTEKPSVTIKAIPPPVPSKAAIVEKLQEKGFIGAFESFIEKKAADNNSARPPSVPKENDTTGKVKQKKPQKKTKGNYYCLYCFCFP